MTYLQLLEERIMKLKLFFAGLFVLTSFIFVRESEYEYFIHLEMPNKLIFDFHQIKVQKINQ